MKQKITNQKQSEPSCYYKSYTLCTCNQSEHCDSRCIGCEECENYISESDYFLRVMEGKIRPEENKKDQKVTSAKTYQNLIMGKSKKALKREAKIEAEKNHEGSGFSIKDDPRFKDLFGGK